MNTLSDPVGSLGSSFRVWRKAAARAGPDTMKEGNVLQFHCKATLKVHPFYSATARMARAMKIQNPIAVAFLLLVAITSGTMAVQASNEAVTNGGFETGNLAGWAVVGSAVVVHYISHSGKFSLQLGSRGNTGQASQEVTLPAGSSGTLSFWYMGEPGDYGTTALIATLLGPNATIIVQWNGKIDFKWHQVTFNIDSQHSGQPLTLRFYGHTDLIYDSYEICSNHSMRCFTRVYTYPVYVFIDQVSVTYS